MGTDGAQVIIGTVGAVTSFAVAVVALVGLRQAEAETKRVRADAAQEREERERQRQAEFQAGVVLKVAELYEAYLLDAHETPGMRALLSALPLKNLSLLRWHFDVWPDP